MTLPLIQENKKCLTGIILSAIFLLFLIYGPDFHHSGQLKLKAKQTFINGNKPTRIFQVTAKGLKSFFKKPHQKNVKLFETKKQYLPNALLIGVRKGGTRALLRAMDLNPNIHTVSKEVHFFDRDENYKKGIEWYRKKMPFVSTEATGQIIMEKTPAYFVTPSVPGRIYNMSKTVKLLVVVRNPTRRSISDYTQLKSKNPSMPPFEEYVTTDEDQKILKVNETCVRIGVYCKHLQNWLKYFPLKQFHFVSGEKLSSDPVPELQNVERFLNLDFEIKEDDVIFNKTKGFPCFKKHMPQNQSPKYSCLGPAKGRKHPKVRSDILQLLMTYYSPYNKQFYKMVNRDFGWI